MGEWTEGGATGVDREVDVRWWTGSTVYRDRHLGTVSKTLGKKEISCQYLLYGNLSNESILPQ